ncbi:enhancer of polycomb-like-domain-containing protein [Chytridium lagenaria]|nr:enhancer of polycomb-like-domain-containing protein [Chytridium lagenaria]
MTAGNTSFGSLRSRKVDLKRSLPVLRWSECPDLDETSSLNRAIPTVATGVEKEEEEEHHLQVALNASNAGLSTSAIVIPTPDASRLFEGSERFYTPNFVLPKSLIKFSAQIEDCISCAYCMDEVDEEWFNVYTQQSSGDQNGSESSSVLSVETFEAIMHTLEGLSNDRDFLGGEPITQTTPQNFCSTITDEFGFRSETDPYVCFRRREIKFTRKARRTDSATLEKMHRLREEMIRARGLLETVLQRESLRKEVLLIEKEVFDQRVLVRKLKKKFGVVTAEKDIEGSPDSRKKKRKLNDEHRTKIKIPVQKLKEAAAFMNDVMMEEIKSFDIRDGSASLWGAESESRFRNLCTPPSFEAQRKFIHSSFPSRVMHVRTHTTLVLVRVLRCLFKSRDTSEPNELFGFLNDQSDGEDDDGLDEIEDELRNVTFRAFQLAPNQEDIYSLMTKPIFAEQINPKPTMDAQRSAVPPPHVSRPPPTPTTPSTNAPNTGTPDTTHTNAAKPQIPQTQPLKKRKPSCSENARRVAGEAKKVQLHLMQGTRTSSLAVPSAVPSNQGSPPSGDAVMGNNAVPSPSSAANAAAQIAVNGNGTSTNSGVSSPKVPAFQTLPVNAPGRFQQQFRYPQMNQQQMPMVNPQAVQMMLQQQQAAYQRRYAMAANPGAQAGGLGTTPHLRPPQNAAAMLMNHAAGTSQPASESSPPFSVGEEK